METFSSVTSASGSFPEIEIIREPEVAAEADAPVVADPHAVVRFLAGVSKALAAPTSYTAMLEKAVNLIVPAAADWCTIDIVDALGGGAYRVAAAHVEASRLHELDGWSPRRPPRGADAEHDLDLDGDDVRDLAMSYVVAPLVSRGGAIGALTLGATDRRYHALDVVVATELGRRIGAALDDARRFDEPATNLQLGALADLLDLAAIDANRLMLAREDVDAGELVADVLNVADVVAARRGARVVRRCELHGAWLDGDRERLAQAIANLVGNALVSCRHEVVVRGVVGAGGLQLAIADDGVGYRADELAHIYDARGGATGLAIARGIVLAHGGAISVACTPMQGSTFVVSLPLRR